MSKPKPWRLDVAVGIGLLLGALLWWSAYDPSGSFLQNPQLILGPAVAGVLVVSMRNRRSKVGPYDPETIAEDTKGRV